MDDDELGCVVDDIPDEALLLGVVEIARYIDTDGCDVVQLRAIDASGQDLALIEVLGMLRMSEDTAIQTWMGNDA